MRFWILLFGAIGLAACGEGEAGDSCDEDDDCEDGLFCDFSADPEADEGICNVAADTGA